MIVVMNMKNAKLYIIVRPIVKFLFKLLYRPKFIGIDKIPKNGRVILAGNHKHNFDSLILLSSTKRPIHFLAKVELFKGLKGIIFKHLGLIPVDRSVKNPEALNKAIAYLSSEKVIGIFPEGTFNRTNDIVMPFKIGAVKMAYETKAPIVPFVITGEYRLFKKGLQIEFLDPIYVNDYLEKENERLRNIIKNKLEGYNVNL